MKRFQLIQDFETVKIYVDALFHESRMIFSHFRLVAKSINYLQTQAVG